MSTPSPIQGPSNQPLTDISSKKSKASKETLIFKSNPLYKSPGITDKKISVKQPAATFTYEEMKKNPKARDELLDKLRPGDIIVVRLTSSSSRPLMQKVNYWFHKLLRPLYERHTKIGKEDTQASHIMLVTHVDKERGELVVSEAVLAGTRTIDYFNHTNFGVTKDVVHEFFRPNFQGNTESITQIACTAMKKQTEAKKSVESEEGKKNTTEDAKKRFAYSKHKAVRSLFTSGYGHTASEKRIMNKTLKQLHTYYAAPSDSPKKKTMFCSQMVSSNLQLGVFHAAVNNLKEKDKTNKFSNDLHPFLDPKHSPSRKEYKQFIAEHGQEIFKEMKEMCPQIKFSAGNMSPTVFRSIVRSGLGEPVANVVSSSNK
ncbi:MAG: hypothetical protein LLF94_10220 [Chlamydiales bacterium]|nr:hypothetical protein [Chlamydiales bacterium]